MIGIDPLEESEKDWAPDLAGKRIRNNTTMDFNIMLEIFLRPVFFFLMKDFFNIISLGVV